MSQPFLQARCGYLRRAAPPVTWSGDCRAIVPCSERTVRCPPTGGCRRRYRATGSAPPGPRNKPTCCILAPLPPLLQVPLSKFLARKSSNTCGGSMQRDGLPLTEPELIQQCEREYEDAAQHGGQVGMHSPVVPHPAPSTPKSARICSHARPTANLCCAPLRHTGGAGCLLPPGLGAGALAGACAHRPRYRDCRGDVGPPGRARRPGHYLLGAGWEGPELCGCVGLGRVVGTGAMPGGSAHHQAAQQLSCAERCNCLHA